MSHYNQITLDILPSEYEDSVTSPGFPTDQNTVKKPLDASP